MALDATEILMTIAKSGDVAPLFFVVAMYNIPGYDPKKAPHVADQYFNGKGWPESAPKEKQI